jgi:hypothetical protein
MNFKKIALLTLIASLAFPALTQAADTYDEQYVASPAPAKNYQGYLLQDSAELRRFSSMLISFNKDSSGKLKSIATCKTLSDSGCESVNRQMYRAILPKCDTTFTFDCINKVFAKTEDGKDLNIETIGTFGANAQFDFKGDTSQNLPSGTGALLIRIPEAPHAGGDLYLVKAEMVGTREAGNAKFNFQKMQTGIFAVSLKSGSYGYMVMSTDIAQYPDDRWVIGSIVGNPAPTGECVMTSLTQCAQGFPLPQNISFGLQFVMNNKLDGWLHGRMKSPTVALEKQSNGYQVLTVQANAIKVPLIDVWVNNDVMPAGLKEYYKDFGNYGSTSFGTKEQPLSEIALRRDMNSNNDESSMKEFINWIPVIGDKAQAMPTAWMLKTMSNYGQGSNDCFSKASGFAGVVSTNAAQYLDGPPTFNNGFLDYKVAAPHLTSSGEVFKGSYDLAMSSDVARCLYGFSKAPVSATVSVVSESGEPNIATTLVREKDGFLFLAAYNFTFSAPTVRVKLTQAKVAAKKTSITCVKGKTSKKVTAVNPKCPTGYKKR